MRISDWSSDVCSSDLQRPHDCRDRLPHGDLAGRSAAGVQRLFQCHYGAGVPAILACRRSCRDGWVAEPVCDLRAGGRAARTDSATRLAAAPPGGDAGQWVKRFKLTRSEEHTSELQSLMRTSYAVFCLKTHTNRIPLN